MNLTPYQVTSSKPVDEAVRLAGNLQRWIFQLQNNLIEIRPGDDLAKLHHRMKDRIAAMESKGFPVCSCAPLGVKEVNRSMIECMAQALGKPRPAEAFLIDLNLRSFQHGINKALSFLIKAMETANNPKIINRSADRLVMINGSELDIQSDPVRLAEQPMNRGIPVLMTIEGGPTSIYFPDENPPITVTGLSSCVAGLILLAIGKSVAESIHLTRQQNPAVAEECINALRSVFASEPI